MTCRRKALILVCVMGVMILMGCNQRAQPTVKAAKHYQLKGKVVSIDTRGKMVNIDSEAIPGFMEAMTMPYQVRPESELANLHPGDSITADLEVQDESAWLQNITVTGHQASSGERNK